MTALPLQPGSASIHVMNAFCISTLSLHGSAPLFQDRLLIAEVRIYRNCHLQFTVLNSAVLACLLTLVLASSASLFHDTLLIAEVGIFRNCHLLFTVLNSAVLACLLILVLASSASLAANAILALCSTGTDHRLLVCFLNFILGELRAFSGSPC